MAGTMRNQFVSSRTFSRRSVLVASVAAIGAAVGAVVLSRTEPVKSMTSPAEFNTDLGGTGRGQYRGAGETSFNQKQADGTFADMGVEFPSHTPSASFGSASESPDRNFRITWRAIETASGVFDWRGIDDLLARCAADGARLTLRIMPLDTSSQPAISGTKYSSLPDHLESVSGATQQLTDSGNSYVTPMWDADAYLTKLERLLVAVGARYNKDERLAGFELSGLGNFGETNVYPFAAAYGGTDRPWTVATIQRVVAANIAAFPDTQLIGFATDQRIIEYLLAPIQSSVQPVRPIGFRIDSLGVEDMGSGQSRLRSIPSARIRWQTAPLWCEYASGETGYLGGLYSVARTQVPLMHVASIGSTNFPFTSNGQKMSAQQYADWFATIKTSGYRYSATHVSTSSSATVASSKLTASVDWTNTGVAPTYDRWIVRYCLNHTGTSTAVLSNDSRIDLRALLPGANVTDTTTMDVSSMNTGQYDLVARAVWSEHKTAGINAYTAPDMVFGTPPVLATFTVS